MSIGAVIFDFGGVLVRTEDPSGRRKVEARLGLPDGELSRLIFDSEVSARAAVGRASDADIWQHVADTLGLGPEQMVEVQRDFWSGDRLDVELVQFLRGLRPRYKTAILSNAWPNAREVFSRVYNLDGAVDEMIISAEERVAKPDARIYQIAIDRLGVRPEEAVFVDDFPVNVQAARAAGLWGVLFRSTAQVVAEVRQHLDGAGAGATGEA